MGEQARTTRDETPRITLDALAAEPERVADEADTGPVRVERPGRADLVLLSAEAFEQMRTPRVRALHVGELTEPEIERMLAREIPEEAARHDHEGGFVEPG